VAIDGSAPPSRVKAFEALDRGISGLRSTDDGKALLATITDDMSAYPIVIAGYNITRLLPSPVVVNGFSTARGHVVCLSGNDNKPTRHLCAGWKDSAADSLTRTTR
jgi:hypothetical protein